MRILISFVGVAILLSIVALLLFAKHTNKGRTTTVEGKHVSSMCDDGLYLSEIMTGGNMLTIVVSRKQFLEQLPVLRAHNPHFVFIPPSVDENDDRDNDQWLVVIAKKKTDR